MFVAYAIICTTPFVIATLAAIGLICWGVGQYRAQYLWDMEDAVCDVADEFEYQAKQRAKVLAKARNQLVAFEFRREFGTAMESYNRLMVAILSRKPEREGYERCNRCDGYGNVFGARCQRCGGYGVVEKPNEIQHSYCGGRPTDRQPLLYN